MLIAQAAADDLEVVTKDPVFARYSVRVVPCS
jgi:PIN domain nuclease of toxin-antitoxin system